VLGARCNAHSRKWWSPAGTALARALQLDEAEREHLTDLARAAGPGTRTRRKTLADQVRPSVVRLLELMTEIPAFVNCGRGDVLAANALAQALYAPMFDEPARPVNHARLVFMPRARDFCPDWERIATDIVSMLRTDAGRDPYNKHLTELVGELCTRSEEFRTRWAAMPLPADPGLT
jgi:hypothetical protein